MKEIHVVGSGVAGLFSALYLKRNYSDVNVTLIEKGEELGGLLRSYEYDGDLFDAGIHTLYETNEKIIDDIILDIVGRENLIELPGDVGGCCLDNQIQTGSPYMNFYIHPKFRDYIPVMLEQLYDTNVKKESFESAHEYLSSRFGSKVAEEVFEPIISNIFGVSMTELDQLSLKLLPMNRCVIDNVETWMKKSEDENYRALFAISDQRLLPDTLRSKKKGYYPKKFGLKNYVQTLVDEFTSLGGNVLKQTDVKDFNVQDNLIKKVVLERHGELTDLTTDGVVWAAGLPTMNFAIRSLKSDVKFQKPKTTYILNIKLSELEVNHDLQYMYMFDFESDIFRIAFYENFTEKEVNKLSVELLSNETNEDVIISKAINKLISLDIIKEKNIVFSRLEKCFGGIPTISKDSLNSLVKYREFLKNQNILNLKCVGVMSEDGLYFQGDILKDACSKVDSLLSIN